MVTTTETPGNYSQLIADVERRGEKKRKEAEARAMSEAGRRGFVSGTGTSDIEFALRRAQTQPIVEGTQSNIANILAQIAAEREARKYQTGEREATQAWQTGERTGAQDWRTGERTGTQDWQSGEAAKERQFSGQMEGFIDPEGNWVGYKTGAGTGFGGGTLYGRAGQAERQRTHEYGMGGAQAAWNRRKSGKWWQGALTGLASGAGAGLGYAGGTKAFG